MKKSEYTYADPGCERYDNCRRGAGSTVTSPGLGREDGQQCTDEALVSRLCDSVAGESAHLWCQCLVCKDSSL